MTNVQCSADEVNLKPAGFTLASLGYWTFPVGYWIFNV